MNFRKLLTPPFLAREFIKTLRSSTAKAEKNNNKGGLRPQKERTLSLSFLLSSLTLVPLKSLIYGIFIILYHLLSLLTHYQSYSWPFYRLFFFCEQVKESFGSPGRRLKLPTPFFFVLWYLKAIF